MPRSYTQGKYHVINKDKYKGNVSGVFYRSSWELKYFRYCDITRSILAWSSEEVVIPYRGLDGSVHRYFMDVWIRYRNKDTGQLEDRIVEIKPFDQTRPPKKQKRRTKQYDERVKTYITNQLKWKAADNFAKKRGWRFSVITEQGRQDRV